MIFQALFLSFLISSSAFAEDLKILSWNVFMIPRPIKNSMQITRSRIIKEQLQNSDYDVILFQEAFTPVFRYFMGKLKSKYPHQSYLGRKNLIFSGLGSGAHIISKHPFRVLDKVYYDVCGGADCYASKGAMLVEVTLPGGRKVQLANTHLQSGESAENASKRILQLYQIRGMMEEHVKPGVPQFLVGDLNIDSVEPEYYPGQVIMGMDALELKGDLRTSNSVESACYKAARPGKEKEWIDHVWMNPQGANIKKASMVIRPQEFTHRGKKCPLSDHHSVEAEFSF